MSMRPKMKRRLLILGGIGALLVALITFGVHIGSRRQAVQIAATREEGMRAYAAGDYPTALKQLSTYLERSKIKDRWPGVSGAEAFFAYAKSRASVPMP